MWAAAQERSAVYSSGSELRPSKWAWGTCGKMVLEDDPAHLMEWVLSNPEVADRPPFGATGSDCGYPVVDLSVRREVTRRVDLFLSVENLLGRAYAVAATPLQQLGTPRLVHGGVRWRWSK